MEDTLPVVLCCSGHDPSGGAGIQADIEALVSMACVPVTVVTAVTVQNSRGLSAYTAQPVETVLAQMAAVYDDMPVAAVKIGMLGGAALVTALAKQLGKYHRVPVVWDPVLATGMGQALIDDSFIHESNTQLMPQVSLLTPNAREARLLTGVNGIGEAAKVLRGNGCDAVLVTGADENTPQVINTLFDGRGDKRYCWPRLAGRFHGTGCTLAAAAAGLLARGLTIDAAVTAAQAYTHKSIAGARPLGGGQGFLDRFYWSMERSGV